MIVLFHKVVVAMLCTYPVLILTFKHTCLWQQQGQRLVKQEKQNRKLFLLNLNIYNVLIAELAKFELQLVWCKLARKKQQFRPIISKLFSVSFLSCNNCSTAQTSARKIYAANKIIWIDTNKKKYF